MKFLKNDGEIEEGTPLTDTTVAVRDSLERYLHVTACKNTYHASYEKTRGCRDAANFIAVIFTTAASAAAAAAQLEAAVEDLFPKQVANPVPVAEKDETS
jgi:hypothetical protein